MNKNVTQPRIAPPHCTAFPCIRKQHSQTPPLHDFHSFGPALHQECPILHKFWPCLMQHFLHYCHLFGPTVPKLVEFSQEIPSTFFHIFGPTTQKEVLGLFTGFSVFRCVNSHSTFLTSTVPIIVGFSQDFHHLMQPFPPGHTNEHTPPMVPAESVKSNRNSDPKQFRSVKLVFCNIFKYRYARIYVCRPTF